MLFKPRTAYEYDTHSNDEGLYTRFAGENPPAGAIIDFYQRSPQTQAPSIEILDARGHVIRRIKAALKQKPGAAAAQEEEMRGPGAGAGVPNEAGINRVVWNFREDGPPQWNGTARQFRGPQVGALVLPGMYAARITLNGRTYAQIFQVQADPHSPYTRAQLAQAYEFSKKYFAVQGRIDTILNDIDAQRKVLKTAQTALGKNGNTALLAKVTAAQSAQNAIFSKFTANYQNDEDSIQYPGQLREDVPRSGFGGPQPPTAALLEYAKRFDTEFASAVAQYRAYVKNVYDPLESQLRTAGIR